jgi:Domain of unknown function (DUF4333)
MNLRTAAALALLTATGFGAAGCGTATVNIEKAETLIADGLEKKTGAPDVTVECPAEVEAKKGGTFECTAKTGGETAKVKATQKDADGNISWELIPN